MTKLPSIRMTYLIGFIIIAAFLGFAAYLELFQGIMPCPLCILQRVCLAVLGIFFLVGAIFRFKKCGNIIIGLLAFLISLGGALLSGRQLWLQHNPLGLSSNCDVSLQYMLKALPLDQVIMRVFQGGTECSQVNWQFLNVSLAGWSFIWFVIFIIVSIWQMSRKVSQ